jgi:hypothetical protein
MNCRNCGRILKMDFDMEEWRHVYIEEAMKDCKYPEPTEGIE